jgi:hypothetical protein
MQESSGPVTPRDVLPDGHDTVEIGGTTVRKGSIRAFIENVKLLETLTPGTAEYQAVSDQLRELKAPLQALDVFEVLRPRNETVARLLSL